MAMSYTFVSMFDRIKGMGALRLMLMATALVFAMLMPMAHLPDYSDEWNLVFNGVIPATSPLIVIVQMLDMLMAQVWKSEETEARIAELNFVIKAHLITGGILLASFLSVFLQVLAP